MIPPPFGRAGVGFSIIFSGGPGGGFSRLWLPRKKTASIKLKTSKYQTEKQNKLFWFAIRAKLQCNKHQTGDQNKLFCF